MAGLLFGPVLRLRGLEVHRLLLRSKAEDRELAVLSHVERSNGVPEQEPGNGLQKASVSDNQLSDPDRPSWHSQNGKSYGVRGQDKPQNIGNPGVDCSERAAARQ